MMSTHATKTKTKMGANPRVGPRSNVGPVAGGNATTGASRRNGSELGRLVQLMWVSDRLLADVGRLAKRVDDACAYLSGSGREPTLALVLIGQLRIKHREAITRLLENCREIRRIVDEAEPQCHTGTAGRHSPSARSSIA